MFSMKTSVHLKDTWTRAGDRYCEDLTEDEKSRYHNATLENEFYDASAAEKRYQASSTSRRWMAKLQLLPDATGQYDQALDVSTNAYPLAMSPLWGSLRVLFHVRLMTQAST